MRFEIGPGVRCDLVAYSGANLSGRRQAMQFFPSGARKGRMDGEIRSVVVRAFHHTRVVLAVSAKDSWELATWRCIRVLPGESMPSKQRNGLPGVRVPDLDLFDAYDAKKTDPEYQSSVPRAESVETGTGWSFGNPGTLAQRVSMIRIHREDVEVVEEISAVDAILKALHDHPEARTLALEAAAAATPADAARLRQLYSSGS